MPTPFDPSAFESITYDNAHKDADAFPNSDIAPFQVLGRETQRLPLVLSSPHSGAQFPESFLDESALNQAELRRSEDCDVDLLYEGGLALGAVMIKACYPRSYIDLNRSADELDPKMFDAPLGVPVDAKSLRVQHGFGVIAKYVSGGKQIYMAPLRASEAAHRLKQAYYPYHHMLRTLIEQTKQRFGYCLVLDCHSMPPLPNSPLITANHDVLSLRSHKQVDIVLGDVFTTTCHPALTAQVENCLRDQGYYVVRNRPYAGGYITKAYGKPAHHVHALQIEVSRSLYLHGQTTRQTAGFQPLKGALNQMLCAVAALSASHLGEKP